MTQQIPTEHNSDTETIHWCSDCGEVINWTANPVVVYIVAGTPDGCTADLSAIHPGIANLLLKPVSRIKMCADCAPKVLARLLAEKAPETGQNSP